MASYESSKEMEQWTLNRRQISERADSERSSILSTDWATTRLFRYDHLDRRLERQHITGIAFAGTVGIGLFISSGELISISGSLGCVIGFLVAGLIVTGVMRSMAGMVSVRPLFNALIDFPQTFVDPALGFSVGVTYWLAQCVSMATLTSAAARVANNFHPDTPLDRSQLSGIIVALLIITLLSNACGVRIYGNIERVVKWIKLLIILSLCSLMIVVNRGNVGYPTEDYGRNYTMFALTPFFNPSGFETTSVNPKDEADLGIPGTSGRFCSVWTSIILAMFPCMGGDIVIVAAGEAKSPRKDLPGAARFMFLAPIFFYLLGSFLVGFNVNYSSPDLLRTWAEPMGDKFPAHSPFIIALKHSQLAPHVLPNLYNALFLFSAYTTGNTALFVSSRTLFALTKTYGNDFFKRTLGRTNAGHTPLAAIIVCWVFGFLAFAGLGDNSFNQPFLSMSLFFTGSIACVYGAECVAYLRFKKGLTQLEEQGLFSRDEKSYRKKFYRPHWQPLWAIFGLVGCVSIMITTPWAAIWIICARSSLADGEELKPTSLLVWDVIGAYSGPFLFFILYIAYKIKHRTSIRRPAEYIWAYRLPEIGELEPPVVRDESKGWISVVKEIWSYIK